jgi:hypothetical protein
MTVLFLFRFDRPFFWPAAGLKPDLQIPVGMNDFHLPTAVIYTQAGINPATTNEVSTNR